MRSTTDDNPIAHCYRYLAGISSLYTPVASCGMKIGFIPHITIITATSKVVSLVSACNMSGRPLPANIGAIIIVRHYNYVVSFTAQFASVYRIMFCFWQSRLGITSLFMTKQGSFVPGDNGPSMYPGTTDPIYHVGIHTGGWPRSCHHKEACLRLIT